MKITQLQKHRTMKEESKTMSDLRQVRMRNSITVQNVREREEAKGANRPKNRSAGADVASNIPVNCVSWNLSDKFQSQYMTADDLGFVTLWDTAKNRVLARYPTGLSLSAGCIEPTTGQQLVCGGTSDSISLFEINRDAKRNEKTDQI